MVFLFPFTHCMRFIIKFCCFSLQNIHTSWSLTAISRMVQSVLIKTLVIITTLEVLSLFLPCFRLDPLSMCQPEQSSPLAGLYKPLQTSSFYFVWDGMLLAGFEERWAIKWPLACALNISHNLSLQASSQLAHCVWKTLPLRSKASAIRYWLKCLFLSVASLATVPKVTFSLHLFRELPSFLFFTRVLAVCHTIFFNVFSLPFISPH